MELSNCSRGSYSLGGSVSALSVCVGGGDEEQGMFKAKSDGYVGGLQGCFLRPLTMPDRTHTDLESARKRDGEGESTPERQRD